MSSARYEPVATTEEPEPSSTSLRPRKYRVIAVVVLVSLLVGLASFYKFGIWILPSAQVESRPSPSGTSLTTPNNKTGTGTQVVMPHGKYSVG